MNLVIDIGNTQIFAGIFSKGKPLITFRKSSKNPFSSDEFGIFLSLIMKEKGINPSLIKYSAIASVVPSLTSSVEEGIKRFISPSQIFILTSGLKTGINIRYKNPHEVGADRIANCIGAKRVYGNGNYIIIDIGTATTFDLLTSKNEYLGGLIIPGPHLAASSLFSSTAKLPQIDISKPAKLSIDTTVSAIQNGIYYLNLFGIKAITDFLKKEFFPSQNVKVIGSGGGIGIFEGENLFDFVNQELVLYGLDSLIDMNKEEKL
ncbi:MAG: type III pantothenate kinase [Elusimicrobiales bacterium]